MADSPPIERSEYGARQTRWPLICVIIAGHVLLLAALTMFDVIPIKKLKAEPLVVELLDMKVAPPPEPPAEKVPPVERVIPQIVAPVPIVQTLSPPPQLAVVPVAPPKPPVITPPSPPAPISVSDLGSKMVAIVPPRYPTESRRRKEQGTVLLSVLLSVDGRVTEVQLARSSGHDRLDKAALDAVRKWRWSPTIRGGEPVMVRGTVDIPFILT